MSDIPAVYDLHSQNKDKNRLKIMPVRAIVRLKELKSKEQGQNNRVGRKLTLSSKEVKKYVSENKM